MKHSAVHLKLTQHCKWSILQFFKKSNSRFKLLRCISICWSFSSCWCSKCPIFGLFKSQILLIPFQWVWRFLCSDKIFQVQLVQFLFLTQNLGQDWISKLNFKTTIRGLGIFLLLARPPFPCLSGQHSWLEELMFNGKRVSVSQDEKSSEHVWWWWLQTTWVYLMSQSRTLKNGEKGQFYVVFILP